ncbi:MAG: hypothetical protein ABSF26_14635 [Thermoguttaceae bacterium]|jgi:hypothetical protein
MKKHTAVSARNGPHSNKIDLPFEEAVKRLLQAKPKKKARKLKKAGG